RRFHHERVSINQPELTRVVELQTRRAVEHRVVDRMQALGIELLQGQRGSERTVAVPEQAEVRVGVISVQL
ncbi:MAG: hypothetical protein QOG95_5092, partial [Mycobacterium sp.]|nr:hypothetical protein [Mycobacterium sp.]